MGAAEKHSGKAIMEAEHYRILHTKGVVEIFRSK
jgi:hypothetical protein